MSNKFVIEVSILIGCLMMTGCKKSNFEPEMVFVEGGIFTMGCTSLTADDCFENEKPAHQVTVSDYYIGKYPITQKQWYLIMGTTVREQHEKLKLQTSFRDVEGDDFPIYYVSWDEAQEFIKRLNKITGKKYRLPTEAEWEYAARGDRKSVV